MRYIKRLFLISKVFVFTVLATFAFVGAYSVFTPDSVEARVKAGENGERVKLIQEKLKEYGLYDGKCDGIYDVETADAVRRFQEHNGIFADGVCGNETLRALELPIYTNGEFETDLLAKLIEAEAGKSDLQTMTAVGAVVVNRVKHKGFPDSVLQVIYSVGAFESVKEGKLIDIKPSELAYRAAEDALMGYDPTDGAVYIMRSNTEGKNVTLKCGDICFVK